MINRTIEKIESAKKIIKYRRTQLEQAALYIRKKTKQNKDLLLKKFNVHVEDLQNFFENYKKRQFETVNDAIAFQEGRIEDVMANIEDQLEELDSNDFNISSLEENDQDVITCMHHIVNELYRSMSRFNPEINLEGLRIDVDMDSDVIHRIDKILSRSAELMHSSLPAMDGSDRDTETFRDLVKNMWNCYNCGSQFSIRHVECQSCKIFRPLETYENILHRPEKVTESEIEALKQRRKIEKQIILDLELNGEDSANTIEGQKLKLGVKTA